MVRRSVSNLCRLMGSWISSGSASERTGTENRKWAITAASAWFLSFSGPPSPFLSRSAAVPWIPLKGKVSYCFLRSTFSVDAMVLFQNKTHLCGVGIKLVLRLVSPSSTYCFSLVLPLTHTSMCVWICFHQLRMPCPIAHHSFHFPVVSFTFFVFEVVRRFHHHCMLFPLPQHLSFACLCFFTSL